MRVFLAAAVLFCGTNWANAEFLTFNVTGEVVGVQNFNNDAVTNPIFKPGDAYTASYTFNTATPDGNASTELGFYQSSEFASFQVGNYSGNAPAGYLIAVANDSGTLQLTDFYQVLLGFTAPIVGDPVDGLNLSNTNLFLGTNTGFGPQQPFNDDSLPTSTTGLLSFNGTGVSGVVGPAFSVLFEGDGRFGQVYGTVNSITVSSSVPEPSSVAIFGLGAIVIGVGSYFRRRKQQDA